MAVRSSIFSLKECDLDFLSRARFVYDNVATLEAPAEEVFDVVSGTGGVSETWFPNFHSLEWLTPPPHGAGSIREYRLTYMRLVEHFIVWERGRRLVFWVSSSSLPLTVRFAEEYRMTAADNGRTRLEWRVAYEPNGWLRPLHPLLRPFFARDFRKATDNLVRHFNGPTTRA